MQGKKFFMPLLLKKVYYMGKQMLFFFYLAEASAADRIGSRAFNFSRILILFAGSIQEAEGKSSIPRFVFMGYNRLKEASTNLVTHSTQNRWHLHGEPGHVYVYEMPRLKRSDIIEQMKKIVKLPSSAIGLPRR